ncbi:uncharacterized protein SAPINGB_P003908 [Magnusiomyces paraingens]|uniref:Uncharacterized protein n=1 Tax=Magnusiomyces paraingens TaxID=2606893 RepID=A0A5E8BRW6_9ASCO|nr:uncharacterized protein SAPINGB_P003908 [Saprochaete ingens]VVT54103.1 unnamed protein product [Saprochaete ingens]
MVQTKLFWNECQGLREKSGLYDLDQELLITVLSSFITRQNIVVTADNSEASSYVQCWLELIASNILGIEDVATIRFKPTTVWADVEDALLSMGELRRMKNEMQQHRENSNTLTTTTTTTTTSTQDVESASRKSSSMILPARTTSHTSHKKQRQGLPRFIIMKDLDRASREIQSLVVQGLVTKTVFCNGVEYPFPNTNSLVVSLINLKRGQGVEGLMPHLKDLFFFRHHVSLEDSSGIPLSKEEIRERSLRLPNIAPAQLVSKDMIDEAVSQIGRIVIIPEIKIYMQDIVVFLRTHRLVQAGRGVSPKGVKDFEKLLRIMCVVHGNEYATPSLVALAARKLFPLKVDMCRLPEYEPTLHYGSDIKLVTQWMKKWDAELIIDDVLNIVPAPL